MSKAEFRAVILTLLFVAVVAAAVWIPVRIMAYSKAHVTLMQTPCYSRCPAFQYDLFGDGTVVYQNADLSYPVTYRISRLEAIHAIWRIDTSTIRKGYWEGVGGTHTPSCIVHFRLSGWFVENVCGTVHIEDRDKIKPALRPLIKVLRLDRGKPDYEPSLPKDIHISRFVPSPEYTVATIWKPSPPPPLPDEGLSK
ncbi:hypothetical protein [Asticcacaulis tiandongensis]|uniref:hypothetical protein n=1 Tax=Asticcacaulis tiandongensis TaxID=2565365 RepID=UPI00112BA2EF|nr:hypothetical protein [Asticcacaulis tiandongensis]